MKKVLIRIAAVIPALILQIVWIVLTVSLLKPYAVLLNSVLTFLAFLYVLYIMSSRIEGSYKTLWLLIILGSPITGTILYLLVGDKKAARPLGRKLIKAREKMTSPPVFKSTEDMLINENQRAAQTFKYLENKTGFPMLPCETAQYYPLGEDMWKQMLMDMENAQQFIFAEYFIIENGEMWNSMVEIMERKVADGVDVRVMYDDLGSISTYSESNVQELKKKGIKCIAFNPLKFILGTINYRDHRKMLIIDGKVAFSGGVNLADEYINKISKYGHWKDIGFRITGVPVQNYTQMFAEFWNAFSDSVIPLPQISTTAESQESKNGYVLSYYDSPLNEDAVSNITYIEILSQAQNYAWFYTPYLMLGDALLDAFIRAAERGVDVRIIMPGVPDKKLIYRMSRSYYADLLKAGVKIYEYTPGFVHAKACISDDIIGSVGTVNLDYRSLFLHFENNTLFYNVDMLKDLKADFIETQEKCRERTLKNIHINLRKWLLDGILQIFAPLC